jgi:hypothetical protein
MEQPQIALNSQAPMNEDTDVEKAAASDDSISVQSQDVKTRQDFKGWTLFYLGLQSIG